MTRRQLLLTSAAAAVAPKPDDPFAGITFTIAEPALVIDMGVYEAIVNGVQCGFTTQEELRRVFYDETVKPWAIKHQVLTTRTPPAPAPAIAPRAARLAGAFSA